MASEGNEHAPSTSSMTNDEKVGLLDLLIVVAKHKKTIATTTTVVAILAILVTLLLPNIYSGTSSVLPPQQGQSAATLLLGQLGGTAAIAASSLGLKNPNELYVGMLKSRTVADNIIKKFELGKVYEIDTMVETRKALASNSTIASGRDGLISIQFDDPDPKRAAAIANAYVEELIILTQTLAVTEAAQRRLFFEKQLQQAKSDLTSAEIALKQTQEKTGLIKLDDQGRAIIEAVASLRGQIAVKEVELRAMRAFATNLNPEYVRTEQQLAGLRSELMKLERAKISGEGDILLPTGKVPEAGLEYLRKLRDVKYQETIYELLAKQFEAAKIDEAKEAAIVQVVDRAVEPDRKSKPKRGLIVIVATLVGLFSSLLWAFVREAQTRAAADPIQATRLATLRRYVSLR